MLFIMNSLFDSTEKLHPGLKFLKKLTGLLEITSRESDLYKKVGYCFHYEELSKIRFTYLVLF